MPLRRSWSGASAWSPRATRSSRSSIQRRLIEKFAGARSAQPRTVDLEQLTAKEREVLEHMARGLSNAEIAEAMYVAEATVKTHVGHVLMKLAVRDRVQAVVLAYEAGIVRPGQG